MLCRCGHSYGRSAVGIPFGSLFDVLFSMWYFEEWSMMLWCVVRRFVLMILLLLQ